MTKSRPKRKANWQQILALLVIVAFLSFLLIYKLGGLVNGLSAGETKAASQVVGWHGLYHQPLYLPLKIVRSIVFSIWPSHGAFLTRLPNAIFGALSVISFIAMIRLWHGTRTAFFSGLMFACGAWILHVSRLASFDVLYLWALPTLLLIYSLWQRFSDNIYVWYLSLIAFGLFLYVPGLIWVLLVGLYFMKDQLIDSWRHFTKIWQRSLYVLIGIMWLPLLVLDLRRPHELKAWLGLPAHFAHLGTLAKDMLAVPFHLFIRGPVNSELWLGKAMVLDVFALITCLIGLYFYAAHLRAKRSRLLASLLVVGVVLVGLSGPVGLSLLVPLLYVFSAAGIAFLLQRWMRVFPNNPLARGTGLVLLSVVVVLSCFYNLQSYFIAWVHNPTTTSIFRYHR